MLPQKAKLVFNLFYLLAEKLLSVLWNKSWNVGRSRSTLGYNPNIQKTRTGSIKLKGQRGLKGQPRQLDKCLSLNKQLKRRGQFGDPNQHTMFKPRKNEFCVRCLLFSPTLPLCVSICLSCLLFLTQHPIQPDMAFIHIYCQGYRHVQPYPNHYVRIFKCYF